MCVHAYVWVCVHMVCVGVCTTHSVYAELILYVFIWYVGVSAYAHILVLFYIKGILRGMR